MRATLSGIKEKYPNLLHIERLLEFSRFVFVGLIPTALHVIVSVVLIEQAGVRIWVANLAAFCSVLPVSYAFHAMLTFTRTLSGERRARPFTLTSFRRFLLTATPNFILTQSSVFVFAELLDYPHRPTILIALCASALISFVILRLWAFDK